MEQFRADLKPFCGNHADWERFDAGLSMLKEQETELIGIRAENRRIFSENIRLNRLLKEQEAITIKKTKEHGFGVYGGLCLKCRNWIQSGHSFCGFCGQKVKWEC